MASNNIANENVYLGVNATDLDKGLAKASKDLNKFAQTTNQQLAAGLGQSTGSGGIGGALKGIFAGMGGLVGTYFGPVGTMIGGAIGSAVGSGVTEAMGVITAPLERLKEIGKLQKTANVFGVSASEYQGLSKILEKAGMDASQTGHLFSIMGKNIAHGLDMDGDKQTAFKNLKLDPEQLKTQTITEQFKTLADAISKLPKGAMQTQSAMAIFGRSAGPELLAQLSKGSAGINDYIAKLKKTGAVLSDEDIARAAEAAKVWKEAKESILHLWEGLYNRALLIAAPFVSFIAKGWSRVITFITPAFESISRGMERAAAITEAVFDVIGEAANKAFEYVAGVGSAFGSWADDLPTVEQVVTSVLKNIAFAAGYLWDALKYGAGTAAMAISGFMFVVLVPLVKTYKETTKAIIDESVFMFQGLLQLAADAARALHMKGMAKDLEDLSFKLHMYQVKNLQDMDKFADKIKGSGMDLAKWGMEQRDAWGSSEDAIEQWFGALDFTQKKAMKGAEQLQSEMNMSAHVDPKIAAAIKGSKEDYSIVSQFKFNKETGGQAKMDVKNFAELQKHTAKLDRIIEVLGLSIQLKAA